MDWSSRGRLRRRSVGAAAGLAVVAAGYGTWQVLDGPQPQVIAVGDAVGGDFTCDQATGTSADFPDGLMPSGAIAVRLCSVGLEPDTFAVPADALVTGAGDLVDTINSASRTSEDPPGSCEADLGPRWEMAVQYPDASVRTVTGSVGGCDDIMLGGTEAWGVADVLLEDFREALVAQRASSVPPAGVRDDAVSCEAIDTGAGFMPWSDTSQLAAVTLCWATTAGGPLASASLTPEQTQIVLADLAANLRATPLRAFDYACPSWTDVRITGRDVWGDPVTIWTECRDFYVGEDYWVPSAPTLELLLGLAGQRMMPPPES